MELEGEKHWENFDILVNDNKWPDIFPCDGEITSIDVVLKTKEKSFSLKVGDNVLDDRRFYEDTGEDGVGVPGVYTAKKSHFQSEFKKGDTLDILSGADNIHRIFIWVKTK
jgi:hypothetical protein